jgi:hypothetical protein
MEQLREQAIEPLEISKASVKCQKCGEAILIVGKLAKSKTAMDKIGILKRRSSYLGNHIYGGNTAVEIKQAKEEEQWVDNHCSCCYFCISFARQIDI